METIWFVEYDKYCQKILAKHWPEVPCYGDIKAVDFRTLPRPDLLCGGFPCQPFSLAGSRGGMSDARWLWDEYLKAICEIKPRWVLVENVPGLLSIENGYVFGHILRDLAKSGYDAEWQVLSAAQFGAPHLRFRVFLIAYPNGSGRPREAVMQTDRHGGNYRGKKTKILQGEISNSNSKRLEIEQLKLNKEKQQTIERSGNGREWWKTEPDVGRVVDGLSSIMDGNIRRLGYENCDTEEAVSKVISYRRGILLSMWEQCQSSKTSSHERFREIFDCMPEVPYGDTLERWLLGQRIKEDQKLCDLWERICAKPFQETQDLQQTLLVRIGETERTQKMAKNRVNRLKCLGNAVVPQVAQWIGERILENESANLPA